MESILPKEVKQPGIKQDFIGALFKAQQVPGVVSKQQSLHNIKS